MSNTCRVCKQDIKVAIYKGTGICSGNCRKIEESKKKPTRKQ